MIGGVGLRSHLQAGQIEDGDLEQAIWLMKKHSAIEATLERARHYGAIARDALAIFPDQPPTRALAGVIGFCVGARAVFRSMMRLPQRFVAGAMWHPSFLVDDQPDSPHLTAGRLARPLFIGIGEADQMQPLSSHVPFLDAVRPLDGVEIAVYPGADHGYTWRGWPSYDRAAADASFASTVSRPVTEPVLHRIGSPLTWSCSARGSSLSFAYAPRLCMKS